MQNEEWRPVKGYEGLYEVSNLGRIKSLPRKQVTLQGRKRIYYERGEFIFNTSGLASRYLIVTLHKDGTRRSVQIHRLVAQAFLPNPNNLPCVNHKDENTLNNAASNLEWCTQSYNLNYSRNRRRNSIPKAPKNNPLSK